MRWQVRRRLISRRTCRENSGPAPLKKGLVLTGISTSAAVQSVMTLAGLVLVALAIREDLIRNRIPNALTAAGAVTGLALAYLADGKMGFAQGLGGILVGLAVLLPFYLLRGMGAGDVKLMAAAGAFVGVEGVLWAAALALLAGGVFAVAIVVSRVIAPHRGWHGSTSGETGASAPLAWQVLIARKERFPYALPIGVGVLGSLWMDGSLNQLYTTLGLL